MKKIRKAFVMSVNPGQEKEYEKRHRPIWPELEAVLKKTRGPQLLHLPPYRDTPTVRLCGDRGRGAVAGHCPNPRMPEVVAAHERCYALKCR